ncbi:MAG TPA: TAXI family TRAP transporter solute-binding subunit [Thermomicrobiales bacterium]|nr:TAXI family TRAP transporter solute-binding subunit [Thermomicrobiales bacterium]
MRSLMVRLAMLFGVLAMISAPAALAQERMSIATGGTGGVYYPYGGGLADLLSEQLEGYEFTAEVTSASVDNMYLIDQGDADLAFVLSDTAYDAVQGNEPFEDPINARSLVTLYNNFTQVVVNPESGIESLEDLAGKTVSTGSPGSGTEVIAQRLLEVAGLSTDDFQQEQLGASESAAAFKDGKIDAFFWSGGLPTSAITDLGATPNISYELLSTDEYVEEMQEQFGQFYDVDTIPADTYPDQSEAVETIVVPNVLVVHADMDEQLAYDIVRTMFEHKDELVAVHSAANNLQLETAMSSTALEYHPGAVRYFEEQGVDIPEATPAS